MIIKRYKKVITQATKALEARLTEELKLVPPEKVKEVITTMEHPLELEFEKERAFMDVAHFVYYKYDKPFLRYRFQLRGTAFRWTIDQATGDVRPALLDANGKPIIKE